MSLAVVPDPDYVLRLEAALEKIAAPRRPDGTYNLGREACEQVAREALRLAPEQTQGAPRPARDGCRTCHRPWEECIC